MVILILLGITFATGWITLINLAVRNEVKFEDNQIKEMRAFLDRDKRGNK